MGVSCKMIHGKKIFFFFFWPKITVTVKCSFNLTLKTVKTGFSESGQKIQIHIYDANVSEKDDQRWRLLVKDSITSLNVNTSNALKFRKYNFYLKDYLKKNQPLRMLPIGKKKITDVSFFVSYVHNTETNIYVIEIIISYLVNNW